MYIPYYKNKRRHSMFHLNTVNCSGGVLPSRQINTQQFTDRLMFEREEINLLMILVTCIAQHMLMQWDQE